MKHAEHCGFSSKPTLNQTGRVEGGELVDEDRLQLGLEGVGLVVGREVAALAAPAADRVDDAADHLLDAGLALRRAQLSAEVLLRDDVRGRLRPELRELDRLLVERGLFLARDERVADLPLDLVERIAAGNREEPPHSEGLRAVRDGVRDLGVGDLAALYGCHIPRPPGLLRRKREMDRRGPVGQIHSIGRGRPRKSAFSRQIHLQARLAPPRPTGSAPWGLGLLFGGHGSPLSKERP